MLLISQSKYLPFEIRFVNCQKVLLYNNGDIYNGFGYYENLNMTESNLLINSSLTENKDSDEPFHLLLSSTEFLIESYLIGFQFFSTTTDKITINLYSSSLCFIESCSSFFSQDLLFSASKIKTWTVYPKIGENQHMLSISMFVTFKSFFTIEIRKKTQILSVITDQYFYTDYEIAGRKLIPILNQQFLFRALTSTYFYKSIVQFNAKKNFDIENKIILPGTQKNTNQKKNMSIELENLKILDQKLKFKIKVFSQKNEATVLIDFGDCQNELFNSISKDYRSYFGLNLNLLQTNEKENTLFIKLTKPKREKKTQDNSYLVINSEFKFDAWVHAFNIVAVKDGNILLKVIF